MSSEHPPAAQFDAGKKFNQGAVSLSAQDRLRFAKQALCVLALICIGAFIGYARFPDNSALIAIFG